MDLKFYVKVNNNVHLLEVYKYLELFGYEPLVPVSAFITDYGGVAAYKAGFFPTSKSNIAIYARNPKCVCWDLDFLDPEGADNESAR